MKKTEEKLSKNDVFAVDTEFEWRKTYFPIISLLQIATKDEIYLVDCKKCKADDILKGLFEDPDKKFIIHAARSDTTVISKCLNIFIKNVFDVQVAEKKLNNIDSESYRSIVDKYFSIKINKSETNSNWLKRPLTRKQIDYASEDVLFLIEIYEKQKRLLMKKKLYDEVLVESLNEANLGNADLIESRLKKFKSSNVFDKKIFLWREDLSKNLNIPPSFVVKDKKIKIISRILKEGNNLDRLKQHFSNEEVFFDFLEEFKI